MTTIVYSKEENVIAVDGRCSRGLDIVSDNYNKVIKREDGITFVVSGSCSDINTLVETYPFGYDGMTKLDADALVIDNGEVYEVCVFEGKYHVTPMYHDFALGSGAPYALAALDFGTTARQAIKYAKSRDTATGGKITVVKVE